MIEGNENPAEKHTVNMEWHNGKISDFEIFAPFPKKVKVRVNGIMKTVTAKTLKI